MTVSDVSELQVPPRRFWVRVGSVILAEGTKFNNGAVAAHWPGHPNRNRLVTLDSMDELMTQIDTWGWRGAHIDWIDPDADDLAEGNEWHVAGNELADHGAAGCEGMGS